MTDTLTDDLKELLGLEGFIELVEKYGGLSTYIPVSAENFIPDLAPETVSKLNARYGGTYIAVPIARQACASYYRQKGMNNREIARKLRVTETAVRKMFARSPQRRPSICGMTRTT